MIKVYYKEDGIIDVIKILEQLTSCFAPTSLAIASSMGDNGNLYIAIKREDDIIYNNLSDEILNADLLETVFPICSTGDLKLYKNPKYVESSEKTNKGIEDNEHY